MISAPDVAGPTAGLTLMMHRPRRAWLTIVLALGILTPVTLATEPDPIFEEVWYLAAQLFYDPNMAGLDWPAVRDRYRPLAAAAGDAEERARVINQMLAELETSHTRLYTHNEPRYYDVLDIFRGALDLEPRFEGGRVCITTIGIVTREIEGTVFLTDVLDGSPAAEAGLLAGDEILGVDGKAFHPLHSFQDKSGETVMVEIRRTPSKRRTLEVRPIEVEPRELYLASLHASAQIFSRGSRRIGYVRARSYAGPHYHEAVTELVTGRRRPRRCRRPGARHPRQLGRRQPLTISTYSTGAWPVMTLLPRDAEPRTFDPQWRKPVVLLVDDSARSGKEILAYGFKKYGIGPVVGERTAGAVVAGRALLLSDWSFLYLAVF